MDQRDDTIPLVPSSIEVYCHYMEVSVKMAPYIRGINQAVKAMDKTINKIHKGQYKQ